MPEELRKLAAIMFTDMVGYSSLTQKNEKLALELLEEHRRILRLVFVEYSGKEIKTIGDAFLIWFDSALEAMHCALSIQDALREFNDASPQTIKIKVRIGVHLGDVVMRGDDVYGDGVNIASRVQSVAEAGGICISEDVFRQVHNKVDAEFSKLGKGALKNIRLDTGIYRVSPKGEHLGATALLQTQFFFKRRLTQYVLLGIAALAISIFTLAKVIHGKAEPTTLTVVITDFINETKEKNLDRQLTGLFISPIEQSPQLEVMPQARLREIAKQMKRDYPTRINETFGREVCKFTNAPILVVCFVKKFGDKYIVDAKAIDPARNQYLITATDESNSIELLPAAVQRLSEKIRQSLELQAETIREAN
jgi:class 3 adenylate cyclase